jgi:hypothetical protein
MCFHKFITREELDKHREIHKNNKFFECDFDMKCMRYFANLEDLETHQIRSHGIEDENSQNE